MNDLAKAEVNASFVAAQAKLDEIAIERQALQVRFDTETERLKLETEELEREVKDRAAKLNQAQQEAMTEKIMATGALALLEQLQSDDS